MKIARIVMQFPMRAKEFKIQAELDRVNVGNGKSKVKRPSIFQRNLRTEYRKDARGYRARVEALLGKAVSCGADVVAFPACTFIYKDTPELAKYTRAASNLTLLAAGAVDLRSGWPEHIVAFEGARRLPTPDYGPYVFDFAFGRCAFAISSSVGKLVDERWTAESSAKPLLVLDMGHQQYSGHYGFHTLPRVQTGATPTPKKTFVVLAWWRWSGGNPTDQWAYPPRSAWSPEAPHRLTEKHDDNEDFIDFFDVKW